MGFWKEYEIERDAMIARGYIPPERGKKYLCGCHFSDGYIRDYIVTNGSQCVCSYCGKKDVVLDKVKLYRENHIMDILCGKMIFNYVFVETPKKVL